MRQLLLVSILVLGTGVAAWAKDYPERTQTRDDIHIQAGDKAAEATCFGCSIYIRGQVNGDATAFGGSVVVEEGGLVTGDATAFVGSVRAQAGSTIMGDATTFGGYVRRDEAASISGDVASFGGVGWLLAILIPPVLLIAGIIALVVWLLRRERRTSAQPYPSAPSMRV